MQNFNMETIDKIIFGDNQFFGINHMSQEKAQQLAEKFFDIKNIYLVYDTAFEAGIKAVMLNSNDRAKKFAIILEKMKTNTAILIGILQFPIHTSMPILLQKKGFSLP